MEHDLKCWPHEFDAVKSGAKTFEVRSNEDRGFAVGDLLVLRTWDPARSRVGVPHGAFVSASLGAFGGYTVRSPEDADTIRARVTYLLHGGRFGLPDGLCVMAIAVEAAKEGK